MERNHQTLAKQLRELNQRLIGSVHSDTLHQQLFATDASVYRQLPIAVAFPKTISDLKKIISFCNTHQIGIIPRTAGTSLAGQCVGPGMVVDVSKHFTKIIDLDLKQKRVTVQPGVIRDDLNKYLAPFGLFFGPNTSTSNRCMIGGMVGNNSSGTTSIQYGVTRDKIHALETLLSDGSEVTFSPLSQKELQIKSQEKSLEGTIYHSLLKWLTNPQTQEQIVQNFPKAKIHRRNTGYALDSLLEMKPFKPKANDFNLSKLLAGSEGTLAFTTSITLNLEPLPPKNSVMIAAHFDSIDKSMQAVVPVMKHSLYTCELIDKTILDCTKQNPSQLKNRFFIQGDPKAILLLEVRNDEAKALEVALTALKETLSEAGLCYAISELRDTQINAANQLRLAGLGLLGNIVGDNKAVACIEDTAVPIENLADYIASFQKLMNDFNQEVVYYAHAGAGELHLRPILNLKKKAGVRDFRAITHAVAKLVKKYEGSLSGEHGDGIVRSEFIPLMVGVENYQLFKAVKTLFDPGKLFNPGKIVDPFPMDQNLRYDPETTVRPITTQLDFSADMGLLRAAEKCNGSGECRTETAPGTMCPSYRATRDEKDSTRGRANLLREVLTHTANKNPFDDQNLKDVFDLCLSCKACASECPSSVDIASYKAEFLFQYQKTHGTSVRDKIFAYNGRLSRWGQYIRPLQNATLQSKIFGPFVKRSLGIAPQRQLPKLEKALFPQLKLNRKSKQKTIKKLYLFLDEFTNYLDTKIGQDTVDLLTHLGYEVLILPPSESGRTYLSKGFLNEAKACAELNVNKYAPLINEATPLIGIEPSAIYTFSDEYPKLFSDKVKAKKLAKNCFLIETFLANEVACGNITAAAFHTHKKTIKIHAHCYQKALGNTADTFHILNLPKNYTVRLLNTGCCGMAGSFGYEKEHYDLSIKIGEDRLFPAIRKSNTSEIIAANGTSCRHQIADGTDRESYHPVSILKEALL